MKKFVFVVCFALLLASCVREPDITPPGPVTGETVRVELNLSVTGMAAGDEMTRTSAEESPYGAATRVIPSDMESGGIYDDNYPTIQNMWIIQFDDVTPDARMLGAPRFLSVTDGDLVMSDPLNGSYTLAISVPLLEVTRDCYTLFVANIRQGGTYNWNLTPESTFSNVITRVKTIQSESGAFEDFTALGAFPDGSRTLLMSAVTASPVVFGTPLEPVFSRNVAKITLKLAMDNPDISIASIRIRNVSNSIVFADAALQYNGVDATTVFPVGAPTIDYEPVTDASLMPGDGETSTFSWYVPRNQQGVDTRSVSVKQKTFFAPANATYIEIVAIKNGFATSVFRIYPGADMVGDFNLIANHEYTVGLNVVDIGTDPSDSRVQRFSNLVDCSGYGTPASRSNSFIINPVPVAEGGARRYLIGVHQVNRYWGDSQPGYGNNPDYVIGNDEPWVVNLIWCDLPGLFSPDPSSTTSITLVNNNGTVVGGGTGPNQAFAIDVPPNLPAGNFVLGLKKANGDNKYLWSWHFWVTDYAPDNFNRSLIDHDTYTYKVPGGQVERLAPGTYGTNYDLLWTPEGFYADKVLMDRFMGAAENFFSTNFGINSRGMLHYQFGRKDPMPGAVTLVTDTADPAFTPSTSIGILLQSGAVTVAESVSNPWVFYGISGNWATDANGTGYQWNDPYITDYNLGKSIYDPCPPGWKMPMLGTWLDLLPAADGRYITVLNLTRDLGWSYGRGVGTADVNVRGLRYWPGTEIDDPVGGLIWYPAFGARNSNTAISNGIGTGINLWVSAPANAANANSFSGGANSTSLRGAARANGYPVRCITE